MAVMNEEIMQIQIRTLSTNVITSNKFVDDNVEFKVFKCNLPFFCFTRVTKIRDQKGKT